MGDAAIPGAERKADRSLTQFAFRRFLIWLDQGSDSGGEKYLEMRRRLVSYFDRRNCIRPDELADETLNRVARRLEEESTITTVPARYCYIVAKFVFLEHLRRTENTHLSIDAVASANAFVAMPSVSEDKNIEEKRLECLEHCLKDLDPQNRELIIQYYHGEQRVKIENRRALAEKFGITVNALSIRACRIRDRLEACVGKCLSC